MGDSGETINHPTNSWSEDLAIATALYLQKHLKADVERAGNYIRIESAQRFSQIYFPVDRSGYLYDLWQNGVCLGNGVPRSLEDLASAMKAWHEDLLTSKAMAKQIKGVSIEEKARFFEKGKEVGWAWKNLGKWFKRDKAMSRLLPVYKAAKATPQLRQLFPYTSLVRLCFSRCTGHPYTHDIPVISAMHGDDFVVQQSSLVTGEAILGRGDAKTAVRIVVAHLPPDIDPAVPGTAEQFVK